MAHSECLPQRWGSLNLENRVLRIRKGLIQMVNRLLLAAFAATLFVFTTGNAEEDKFDVKCIISGGPAKKASFVSFKGTDRKVYFCCNNCPKAYKADPAKFAAIAHHQLAVTKQIVQVACPLTGGKIDASTAIEVNGAKVAFCCNNCKGKAEKAEDQVSLVYGNIAKGFTLQTVCPVSGKKLLPKHVVVHKGKKVYFCCPGCPGAFKKDPDAFTGKLPQFQVKEEKKS